ncbi:MAG: hypothetical protein IT378_17835 [Sandaracinaceae bacterium]|nr:hypothetical protein [Sandaracinaceae bacterium]
MSKLLLTSVCRPFGGPGEGDSVGAELFHAQVTRAQGPLGLRQVIRVWALDYIAENLVTPTVTLHYPSKAELVRELRTGQYTHVGIHFVVATFHKVREMVPLVRKHAPHAKIVLGGYGTVLPDEVLAPFGDAICREEGVGFMRKLLGEPMDTPLRHPHAPIPSVSVLGVQQSSVVGHVTAGLGCPNGCDFCCTSHFFDRKYLRFADRGRDVYEALMATRARSRADGVPMNSFILIDEDFFLHHKRAREFLSCVREGGESFGLMGFDLVWNAFEGKKAGYRKQRGKPLSELYRDLRSVGVAQLTSMIIGFPYQDEATIHEELDELMALEPALTQCLIYFAFPGTPLHDQVIAQGRYREAYRDAPDLRRWDGFAMHFDHPKMEPSRVEALQREIYQQDFARLGPSTMRLARVWLEGHRSLRHDASPLLAARSERLRESVRALLPTLLTTALFAPSAEVRARALALRREIHRLTGAPTAVERAMETAAPALFAATTLGRRLGALQQPGLLRTEHRLPGEAASRHTRRSLRVQGGLQSGVVSALVEDAREAAGRAIARWLGKTPPPPPPATRVVTERATRMPRSLPIVMESVMDAAAE